MGLITQSTPSEPGKYNSHDVKVILFQVIIFIAQAVLVKLGAENFGQYTPYVVLAVQVATDALRRFAS